MNLGLLKENVALESKHFEKNFSSESAKIDTERKNKCRKLFVPKPIRLNMPRQTDFPVKPKMYFSDAGFSTRLAKSKSMHTGSESSENGKHTDGTDAAKHTVLGAHSSAFNAVSHNLPQRTESQSPTIENISINSDEEEEEKFVSE